MHLRTIHQYTAAGLRFPRLTHRLGRDYYLLLLDLGVRLGESSAAAAARQPGPTIETRLLDTERRI
ncbi:hypothetical protein Tco_0229817, partial [Tanacetum coccineum]